MKEYTSDEMLALLLSDGTISQEQHDEITNWNNLYKHLKGENPHGKWIR
jgi:hypothetical protein